MKTKFLCLSILASLLASRTIAEDITNKAPAVATGLAEVWIRLPVKEIKTNQPLVATIVIKNISTNETLSFDRLLSAKQDDGISLKVISPSGQDVSPKPPIGGHGSGYIVTLRSNQVHNFQIPLSEMCRFNEIGTYKIAAKKRLTINGVSTFWEESKVVEISVVPGKWEVKSDGPAGF